MPHRSLAPDSFLSQYMALHWNFLLHFQFDFNWFSCAIVQIDVAYHFERSNEIDRLMVTKFQIYCFYDTHTREYTFGSANVWANEMESARVALALGKPNTIISIFFFIEKALNTNHTLIQFVDSVFVHTNVRVWMGLFCFPYHCLQCTLSISLWLIELCSVSRARVSIIVMAFRAQNKKK